MKIYVSGVPDVTLESPISEPQLIVMVDAWQHGVAHSQIIVSQGSKKGMLDTRDIDVTRTLPDVIFGRASTIPPAGEMAVVNG